AAGYTGDGWYVAVIDTGIRRTHEMFAGKNITEACFSNNDCPDGSSEMIGTGSAAHYESSYKAYDHGTHVAGIAAGNSAVQKGVAKDADIIAIQVFSRFENNSLCGGTLPLYDDCVLSYTSDQMAALDYIYDTLKNTHSIAAINMSLGGGQESGYCDNDDLTYTNYINVLTGAGIAVAIATGNESYCGYISSPACIEKAVAVGAVTVLDVEASFSNYQINLVDIFAPGVTINSAVGSGDTDYAAWNGTSMATPHVAGAFAVFREKNNTLTVDQLETVMKNTRSAVTYGCTPHGTEGRINVDSVINSIADSVDTTVPYNVTVNINNGSVFTNSRSVTVSLSGSDGTGIDGYYVSESGTTPDAADFSPVSGTVSLNLNLTFSLTGADGTKTVYAWLKDGSGNISAAASDSITLDTTAPYVVSVSPSNNSADVAVTTNISVQFSESILSSTLSSAHLSLVNQSTMTPVTEGDLSVSGNNVTFNPSADLSSGTAYTVNVTDGIRDQAGNQLSPEFQSFFVTLAAQGGDDNDTDDNNTDDNQTDGGEDNETDDGDDNESGSSSGGSGGGGCSAGAEADYALIILMLVSGIILMRRKV
ncbi:MAG: S8 family serine peptidase, partial [Deferribacterales bacterium]